MSFKSDVIQFLDTLEKPLLKDLIKKYPTRAKTTLKSYLTEYRNKSKVCTYQNIPTYSELIQQLYQDFTKERDRRVRKEIASEIRQLLKEKGSTPDKPITILEELELWKQKKSV